MLFVCCCVDGNEVSSILSGVPIHLCSLHQFFLKCCCPASSIYHCWMYLFASTFPFFGVSGNVHSWIVKVLAAVCALDHFAKAWLFAVQTFDLFCQVRVFAAADKFWEEVVHEERFSLGKSFL